MMADGTRRQFAGKVSDVKIRIHDYLTLHVKNLRVLPGKFSQVIIGADILSSKDPKSQLREVGTQRDGDHEVCKIEYGTPRNGIELSLRMYYASPDHPSAGGSLKETSNAMGPGGGQSFTAKPVTTTPER